MCRVTAILMLPFQKNITIFRSQSRRASRAEKLAFWGAKKHPLKNKKWRGPESDFWPYKCICNSAL